MEDGGQTLGPVALRRRIAMAIALTVAFYVLALAIGIGLIAAPIAVYATAGVGNIWVTVVMIAAGFAVLRAIVPPRHRFQAPGPALGADGQPRLHAVLAEVGERAGEPVPGAVYLDLDVNASVAELPRGRGRVLLLGLPLLAALTPDELRAVVGHELGHYAGGDTRWSAWIWRTRVTAMRTVQELGQSRSAFRRGVVQVPFLLYAKAFERLTNAVSRRQELAADQASARVAGAGTAATALRRVSAAAPAYGSYWENDLGYLLDRGRRPPIARGFATFLAGGAVAPALDEVVAADVRGGDPDPYASHPTLGERLRALGVEADASAPPAVPFAESAAGLLEDPDALERELLRIQFGEEAIAGLEEGEWDDLSSELTTGWGALRERLAGDLGGMTVGAAGDAAAHPEPHRPLVKKALGQDGVGVNGSELDPATPGVFGALVAHALVGAGWEVAALPGEKVTCHRGDAKVDPETALEAVAESGDPGPWHAWAAEAGVAGLAL